MTKYEFETIAGYEVSDYDYFEILEPMYMALPDVTKQEFVKMIDKKRFELKKEDTIITVGVKQMPNGTWMTYKARIKDIDIRTGKYKVVRLTGMQCNAEISYNVHYLKCKEV